MIAIHQSKIISVHSLFQPEIENQRIKALKKLNKVNKNQFNTVEKDYLREVIALFEDNSQVKIIELRPSDILTQIRTIGVIPPNSRFYKNGRPKKTLKQFILQALNYSSLRSSFYPKYFKSIGIKSCVYCNSQLSITAIKSKGVYSAKFDVDHYHSKDSYPFLSISLFNLYPACSSCNRAKSNNEIEFELYTNDFNRTIESNYKFKLSPYSKSKYLTTRDSKDIDFTFSEPIYSNAGVKKFNEVFHIEGIYETQDDLIEELIIKSQIYNKSYLKILKDNFRKLSLNPELFKRTLIGNYTKDKDIHKRPMSKLVMDIAKDLGLI
jgi:5-methylcytosine-specific restriction endonuclease McrA